MPTFKTQQSLKDFIATKSNQVVYKRNNNNGFMASVVNDSSCISVGKLSELTEESAIKMINNLVVSDSDVKKESLRLHIFLTKTKKEADLALTEDRFLDLIEHAEMGKMIKGRIQDMAPCLLS